MLVPPEGSYYYCTPTVIIAVLPVCVCLSFPTVKEDGPHRMFFKHKYFLAFRTFIGLGEILCGPPQLLWWELPFVLLAQRLSVLMSFMLSTLIIP